MTHAPTSPPSNPANEIAPDVPGATAVRERNDHGVPPNRIPISVDHVSAPLAASEAAPATASSAEHVLALFVLVLLTTASRSRMISTMDASANTPPLASTCHASRRSPLSMIDENLDDALDVTSRDNMLASTNHSMSSTPHPTCARSDTAPTNSATTAPSVRRLPRRRASAATLPAIATASHHGHATLRFT